MAGREAVTSIGLKVSTVYSNVQDTAGFSSQTPTVSPLINTAQTWQTGVGANQANRAWLATNRSLASTSENIDLFDLASVDIGAGAGLDQLGQGFALTGVKALYVFNRAASGGAILVGGLNAATAWNSPFNGSDTALISVPINGTLILTAPTAAGFAVADTTNHLLKIDSVASTSAYDILIIGI